LQYPSNVRVVRVMCSASVSPHYVLLAFQQGVDGVFVGG
jgi:F420-non-reducing hydrogenase iron-sulfur subunit